MKSKSKFDEIIVDVVGYGLLLTGFAKLISLFGHAHVLDALDPILKVRFRVLFGVGGFVEIIVALIVLFSENKILKVWIISGIFLSFLLYHIAIFTGGISAKICPCLGNLYGVIPIKQSYLNFGLWSFLIYGLGVGLYLFLKFVYSCRVKLPKTNASEENF
jgi:hypothetical protein